MDTLTAVGENKKYPIVELKGIRCFSKPGKVLRAGQKLIYSASYYLDYLGNGGNWGGFYKADPRLMIPKHYDDLDLNKILGGEACMWGEVVDDSNFMSRVWPRTSAVAERLWSPEPPRYSLSGNMHKASCRLEEHTCRMNRRGVAAQPPNGPGFCVA